MAALPFFPLLFLLPFACFPILFSFPFLSVFPFFRYSLVYSHSKSCNGVGGLLVCPGSVCIWLSWASWAQRSKASFGSRWMIQMKQAFLDKIVRQFFYVTQQKIFTNKGTGLICLLISLIWWAGDVGAVAFFSFLVAVDFLVGKQGGGKADFSACVGFLPPGVDLGRQFMILLWGFSSIALSYVLNLLKFIYWFLPSFFCTGSLFCLGKLLLMNYWYIRLWVLIQFFIVCSCGVFVLWVVLSYCVFPPLVDGGSSLLACHTFAFDSNEVRFGCLPFAQVSFCWGFSCMVKLAKCVCLGLMNRLSSPLFFLLWCYCDISSEILSVLGVFVSSRELHLSSAPFLTLDCGDIIMRFGLARDFVLEEFSNLSSVAVTRACFFGFVTVGFSLAWLVGKVIGSSRMDLMKEQGASTMCCYLVFTLCIVLVFIFVYAVICSRFGFMSGGYLS